MLGANPDHGIQVSLTPSFGIAQGDDDYRSLLNLRLFVGGNSQLAALFGALDDYEPPRLQILTARGLQPGDNNSP